MTIENVQNAIASLEGIDPADEFAYEKAFLAYMTIKKLPTLVFDIKEDIEVFRARTTLKIIYLKN